MSYELDPLPYDYDALEPHLSEQVLEWHHDTHHQGYVNGWNSAEETLEANREEHDFVVGRGDPERDPQLVGSHPARPVLAEHEPGGRRRARWRAGRPDRGGLRLVRRLEGRVRGGGVRRVRLGALSVRHILEPAAERRGRQDKTTRARSGAVTRFWRWTCGSTPTTTTTARLVASSSTTSSRSSTGTSPRPATSRPSSCSSNAPRSTTRRARVGTPRFFG